MTHSCRDARTPQNEERNVVVNVSSLSPTDFPYIARNHSSQTPLNRVTSGLNTSRGRGTVNFKEDKGALYMSRLSIHLRLSPSTS
jgi:hypothetical protein